MEKTAHFLRGVRLSQSGFTIIEALVVIGMTAIILAISVVAISRPQAQNSVVTTANTFISDLKQQQMLSMMGDSGTQTLAQAHGVRVTASSYTVFTGATFATSTNQFSFNLPQGITFSGSTFPLDIIFAKRSGETTAVSNLSIGDTAGDQKVININRLGATQ